MESLLSMGLSHLICFASIYSSFAVLDTKKYVKTCLGLISNWCTGRDFCNPKGGNKPGDNPHEIECELRWSLKNYHEYQSSVILSTWISCELQSIVSVVMAEISSNQVWAQIEFLKCNWYCICVITTVWELAPTTLYFRFNKH